MKDHWFDLASLGVSLVALFVSCQANNISKENETRLRRIECADKLDESAHSISAKYRKIIPLMSQIYNNRENASLTNLLHSEFQEVGQDLLDAVEKFEAQTNRYDAKCPSFIADSMNKARVAGLQIKDDELKDFVAFAPDVMQRHRENLEKMFKGDVLKIARI